MGRCSAMVRGDQAGIGRRSARRRGTVSRSRPACGRRERVESSLLSDCRVTSNSRLVWLSRTVFLRHLETANFAGEGTGPGRALPGVLRGVLLAVGHLGRRG